MRWCRLVAAAAASNAKGMLVRLSGVTTDITDRKEAENKQALLAREVDHRAKNALAVVQAIVRLAKRDNIEEFITASRAASTPWPRRMSCCRVRAGKAPMCCAWCWRNWRPIRARSRNASRRSGRR